VQPTLAFRATQNITPRHALRYGQQPPLQRICRSTLTESQRRIRRKHNEKIHGDTKNRVLGICTWIAIAESRNMNARLWENRGKCGRSHAAASEPPYAPPHPVDQYGCSTYQPPATLTSFQINGTVSLLTGNGRIAPFETDPPSSTLQVCVTGGEDIRYSLPDSNITLVFGGPATTHFGPQAIRGVVRKPEPFAELW
jgi:hypothetical protein